ncbi:MAG: assimilatory sulfite reductase (NADPH) hemoprotein subunit [Lysobacterales bacterium]|jgi:sulfite reductase (NADPH) hemoprotein beta-component
MSTGKTTAAPPSEVEEIKAASNYLRGTLKQSLDDSATGSIADNDTQLSKFHGVYQQDDRDVRDERRRRMLEPDHSFMIRARVPGGVCTPDQWLTLDRIATTWANHSLRLTTRQAFQFHGVMKGNLKASIQSINAALLDTLAACGDVNRNVMCCPLPELSRLHEQVYRTATALSEYLTPRTSAYHEIWLDRKKVAGGTDSEPIYGATYLPRKFKIAFAIPPTNDVDVLANDLGFIATAEDGELTGFNVAVGGGMGATHGNPATFPRLADVFGWCKPEQVKDVSRAIVTIQRDFGDRSERKHARFKYTLAERGLEWLSAELEQRLGYALDAPRPFRFSHNGDRFGWQETDDGKWHLLLYIENGRIADRPAADQLTGLREIAQLHRGEFRLTPNQNLVIANVDATQKQDIEGLVKSHGLDGYRTHSPLRLHAMACVALPTCSLAMAEAERYLPDLTGRIEALLMKHGLQDQAITLRMTGCPNGCARPYLAEIGLVGKAPGRYNLHLGAAFDGTRLNTLVKENVDEAEILASLDSVFAEYTARRREGEHFGDFLARTRADQPGRGQ